MSIMASILFIVIFTLIVSVCVIPALRLRSTHGVPLCVGDLTSLYFTDFLQLSRKRPLNCLSRQQKGSGPEEVVKEMFLISYTVP
jgi:hypothetical protein